MSDWVVGKIIKVNFWTDVLFTLTAQAPVHPFSAGQFTKLGLKVGEERISRAYSYVNSPDNPNLEFYLIAVKGGKLSPQLASLRPGDEVQISSTPSGFFVLNEVPNCDTLWMLATGTGIGPYLSILQYGKDLERFKNIVLVQASRYASGLNYFPLMKELETRYKGKLRIQTVVTREINKNSLHGRFPALIESGVLEKSVGLRIDASDSHIMLCGNPEMVFDTEEILKKTRKMVKNLRRRPGHITTEQYW